MLPPARQIAANLATIHSDIDRALEHSGRSGEHVELVAVTKYVDVETTRLIAAAGCRTLGESRPQDLWKKAAAFAELQGAEAGQDPNVGEDPKVGDDPTVGDVRWHMIGHLQRNKVRRTLPLVDCFHSGDSQRLLQAVNDEAKAACEAGTLTKPPRVLLEINVSGDPSKHGFDPQEIPTLWEFFDTLRSLQICGVMGMASLHGGRDAAQRDFARLRELRDRWRGEAPESLQWEELSMGMSGDFDLAIAEGSTMVRIGSRLVEGIPRSTR